MCFRERLGVSGKPTSVPQAYLAPSAPWDLRMPGAGGAPGGGFFLLQRTFQKASHCRDHRHWWTIDPAPFIWAALPAPCLGLWSVHSESQMHAWAPATDRVRRVCWPGRAPSLMLSLAGGGRQLWLASPFSVPLLSEQKLPGPGVGVGGSARAQGRAGGGPQAKKRACGASQLVWGPCASTGLACCPGQVPSGLGLHSQMWRLAAVMPPGLPVRASHGDRPLWGAE